MGLLRVHLWELLTAVTSGSVAINGLILWHVPCIHYDCLSIDSTSASISLTLALIPAAASAGSAVLKSAAGVTIIGNSWVCVVLVTIAACHT